MECDSMHSVIEKSFKNKEVDLPSDYIQHMKLARRASLYHVQEPSHKDFLDFKTLNETSMKPDAFSGIINAHYFKYIKKRGG